MIIGVPREIKDQEARVAVVPSGARALTEAGHSLLVERGAGLGSGIEDAAYEAAGARIVDAAAELWHSSEMIIKVKEPLASEYELMQPRQLLFTYLHLAPLPELTQALLDREVSAVAYETIEDDEGNLPLLTPMSEVAGRMSIQVGADYLMHPNGGRGVLLSGVPGVAPGRVVIIGGGVVGLNAAKVALGMGAHVIIFEKSAERMRYLDDVFQGRCTTLMSNALTLEEELAEADLVVGAVLVHGARAPRVVTREMLAGMNRGAVLVDVAVDQGGCFETTHATTHSQPTYEVDGVVHYAVANMPGAVPRTSTFALTNVTLPYALRLAGRGLVQAVGDDAGLAAGVNTYAGRTTCEPVAVAQEREHTPLAKLLG